MDNLDLMQHKADAVNTKLVTVKQILVSAGIPIREVTEATIEADAGIEINDTFSISIPCEHRGFDITRWDGKYLYPQWFPTLKDVIRHLRHELKRS